MKPWSISSLPCRKRWNCLHVLGFDINIINSWYNSWYTQLPHFDDKLDQGGSRHCYVGIYHNLRSSRFLKLNIFDILSRWTKWVWENLCPGGESIFSIKVTSHLPSYLKGHHNWSMHVKYEVSITYGYKVIRKIKVDNTHRLDRD